MCQWYSCASRGPSICLWTLELMVRASIWKRTKAYIRRMRSNKAGGWIALLLLLILGKIDDVHANYKENNDYRLPKNAVPSAYEIKIEPHIIPGNFTFNGEENIVLNLRKESLEIILHAHSELHIEEDDTILIAKDGKSTKPKSHVRKSATDFLTLTFEKKIAPGDYTLHLKFIGMISNGTNGVYRSAYLRGQKDKVWTIATSFSRIFARKAFPCWDEPAFKATFNLSLKHYPNYTAASNMPMQRQVQTADGKVWTNFQITPKMSTYMFAFVISDLPCISNTNKLLKMCATKEALPDLKYVQTEQDKALALSTQYTGIPYALPKLDSYVLPDEEVSVSMENWGLIVDRESPITVKDDTIYWMKEYATVLTARRMAYQSFGNLVSPAWWTDFWLNEGVIEYLHLCIRNQMHPDWDLLNMFVSSTSLLRDRDEWLNWDSKKLADAQFKLPLHVYSKSTALMHMLSNIVSKEVFQEGVRIFFKKHQYGVATPDDFWSAIQEAHNNARKDPKIIVRDVMNSWTSQLGYPMVRVTRDYKVGTAIIHHPNVTPGQPSSPLIIPINYATKSNPNFQSTAPTNWLKPGDGKLVIEGLKADDWIILNIQQSGYYGVDYDAETWERIIEYLNSEDYTKIHALNRAQLMLDSFYTKNYMRVMKLTSYLSRETELIPWNAAKLALSYFKHHLSDDAEIQQNLNKYVELLIKRVIDDVGFNERPSDSDLIKTKRSFILVLGSRFNNTKCLEAEAKKALAHLEERPHRDFNFWEICYGASDGRVATLLEKKIEEGNVDAYFKARSCSRYTKFWEKYLKKIATNPHIAKNNTQMTIINLAEMNVEGWDWGLKYYMDNFHRLLNDYSQSEMSYMLNHYIGGAATPSRLEKIRDFVNKNQDHLEVSVKDQLSAKSKQFEWSRKIAPQINDWLKKQINLLAGSEKI